MKYDCEFPGTILLEVYLCISSLLRGDQLPPLGTFLGCLQCPEIFIPLR
jgi:hypothetical protein